MKEAQLLNRPATAMAGTSWNCTVRCCYPASAPGVFGMAYVALAMPAYHFLTAAGSLIFPPSSAECRTLLKTVNTAKPAPCFGQSARPGVARCRAGRGDGGAGAPVASQQPCRRRTVSVESLRCSSFQAAAPIRGFHRRKAFRPLRPCPHRQVAGVLLSSLAGFGNENPAAWRSGRSSGICIAEAFCWFRTAFMPSVEKAQKRGSPRDAHRNPCCQALGRRRVALLLFLSLLSVFDAWPSRQV